MNAEDYFFKNTAQNTNVKCPMIDSVPKL